MYLVLYKLEMNCIWSLHQTPWRTQVHFKLQNWLISVSVKFHLRTSYMRPKYSFYFVCDKSLQTHLLMVWHPLYGVHHMLPFWMVTNAKKCVLVIKNISKNKILHFQSSFAVFCFIWNFILGDEINQSKQLFYVGDSKKFIEIKTSSCLGRSDANSS